MIKKKGHLLADGPFSLWGSSMGIMYGMLSDWSLFQSWLFAKLVLIGFGYFALPLWLWGLFCTAFAISIGLPLWICSAIAVGFGIFIFAPLRRLLFTRNVMAFIQAKKLLPVISETEKVALEAGNLWVDAELFQCKPNFEKVLSEPLAQLSEQEKAFLAGPCEQLCKLCKDEESYRNKDLSLEVWAFLKKEKFFGLCIPKEFGGLGFSAAAHSEVVQKVASRSIPLAITTMVPNSLGPAELIMHYGTDEQKRFYLPRLASGEEIPCFALTEPDAGSDAGSIEAEGVLIHDSKGELCLKLNWKKRYITLGSASTVLGLAVKVLDPNQLLGKVQNLGITCVLVPSQTPGVNIGLRHDPLGVPFINSPLEGIDVVVPITQVIGGAAGIGKGWRMLMECLAAGRSLSLPSYSSGAVKKMLRATSSYIKVRQQFSNPLWRFEGIDEVFAETLALGYVIEASRLFTVGALDRGIKPAVISAITKYQATEIHRMVASKSMDIWGGAGISLGLKNVIARYYMAAPISITVEGANILTRSMIIFGQGAIRCHPYAYAEIKALQEGNVRGFDEAFTNHIGRIMQAICRLFIITLTRAKLVRCPSSRMASYYRKLSWSTTAFVVMSEAAMLLYGGNLKFREKLTGRFSDILSWMYLLTATLRRYESSQSKNEEALVHYAAQYALHKIENAFQSIYQNIDIPVLGWVFKSIFLRWSRINPLSAQPDDKLATRIVQMCVSDPSFRDLLTKSGIYLPQEDIERMYQLDRAYELAASSAMILQKVTLAMRKGQLTKGRPHQRLQEALEKGLLSSSEVDTMHAYKEIYDLIISVDAA